jgi:Predicted flavoprotein
MRILAFAGSNSRQSINRKFVIHTTSFFKEHDITLLDLNDFEMPLFSVDREANDGYPERAYKLIDHISEADLIILSLAEHNGSYTVAFKNVMDWCSRTNSKFLQNKPMFLMSTSPGGFGGGNVMNAAIARLPRLGADVLTTFSLPSFYQNFDQEAGISNPELLEAYLLKINEVKARMSL